MVYNTKIADSLHPYPLESKNWTQNGVFQRGKEDDIILGLSEESTPVWESVKGCVLLKSIVFMHRIVKKNETEITNRWWVISIGEILGAKAWPELYSQYPCEMLGDLGM